MQANKILLIISLALFTHSKILVMDVEDLRKLSADGDLRSLLPDTTERSLESRRLGTYWGTCWTRAKKIYEGFIDMDTSRAFVPNNYNGVRPSDSGVWVPCARYKLG